MHSNKLKGKIDVMFAELKTKATAIIEITPDIHDAGAKIANLAASETSTRSKTMLTDMCADLTAEVFKMPEFSQTAQKNRFYAINLEGEIMRKYSFDPPKNVSFDGKQDLGGIAKHLVIGAGTATISGVLLYALTPVNPPVSVGIVIGAFVASFCISYFASAQNPNKANFAEAVNQFLDELKLQFIAWLDEIERYWNKRVGEIKSDF